MKLNLLAIILVITSQVAFGQIAILDEINEMGESGYDKSVLSYNTGYYIDNSGVKHEGLLKLQTLLPKTNMVRTVASEIWYKQDKNQPPTKLTVDDVKSAEIGGYTVLMKEFPSKFFSYKMKKDFIIEAHTGKISKYVRMYAYDLDGYKRDTAYTMDAIYIKSNEMFYIPTYYSATKDAKKAITQLLGKNEDLDDFFEYMENAFKRKKGASLSSFFRRLDRKVKAYNEQ